MGAVTASGAKQQRQSYNSKRGEEELLKVLHFFVWRLKHSSNTNTPPSSSLNEQIADWSKCWMIMAEDGCVGFAGWYHGFPLVSPAQPSVPEPCVVPKGSLSAGFTSSAFPAPVYECEAFSTEETQRRHGSLSLSPGERRQLEGWERAEVETKVIIMVPESDARLHSRRQNEKGGTCWLQKQCFSSKINKTKTILS